MKKLSMLIFLIVILSIHTVVNFYIYHRGIQGLEAMPQLILPFKLVMLTLFLSYIIGRFLEKVWISPVSDLFHWVGAFWFAGMLYSVMIIFSLDIVRLLNGLFHFLPSPGTAPYQTLKFTTTWISAGAILLIITIGFINAWHPKIVHLTIPINKNGNGIERLKIVAVSDIHMGTIIAKGKTNKLVNSINQQNPDLILFAGDVVDEDVQPVIRLNLGQNLTKLKAPLGVFAITGNHEYIGGVENSTKYLSDHGLTLLRDSSVLINNAFYIVGREDKDKLRFTGENRKEVAELVDDLDHSKPIILLDHQPYNLDKATEAGIDLQLSGHTHHGQLWPFGWITERIFEVSRGYKQKENSHFYVSTGFGTWGPPVRLGNRPEIVVIELVFNPDKK